MTAESNTAADTTMGVCCYGGQRTRAACGSCAAWRPLESVTSENQVVCAVCDGEKPFDEHAAGCPLHPDVRPSKESFDPTVKARLKMLAASMIVGADIKLALEEIESLKAAWNSAYQQAIMNGVEADKLRAKLNPANREPPHCSTCDCGSSETNDDPVYGKAAYQQLSAAYTARAIQHQECEALLAEIQQNHDAWTSDDWDAVERRIWRLLPESSALKATEKRCLCAPGIHGTNPECPYPTLAEVAKQLKASDPLLCTGCGCAKADCPRHTPKPPAIACCPDCQHVPANEYKARHSTQNRCNDLSCHICYPENVA